MIRCYENKRETFKKHLFEAREYFRSIGMDDRMSMNYSVPVAGYCVAFNDKDLSFATWLKDEIKRIKVEQDSDNIIDIFLSDLQVLKLNKKIDGRYWDVSDGKIFLYLHGLYNVWAQDYRNRKGEPPFKASSIRDYLKDEPGYLERTDSHWFDKMRTSGIVFDYESTGIKLRSLVDEDMGTMGK
jgi:hypothetical protein